MNLFNKFICNGSVCIWMIVGGLSVAIADVSIIVNPKSSVDTLSSKQVKSIFLGKSKKIPDGGKAEVIDQSKGNSSRDTFNDKVLNKNERKLKAYWSKQVFSGKGSPPKQLNNDDEVKAYVRDNKNAIGYIDSGSVDSSVKSVLTIK